MFPLRPFFMSLFNIGTQRQDIIIGQKIPEDRNKKKTQIFTFKNFPVKNHQDINKIQVNQKPKKIFKSKVIKNYLQVHTGRKWV